MKNAPTPLKASTAKWQQRQRAVCKLGFSDPFWQQTYSEIQLDELLNGLCVINLNERGDAYTLGLKIGGNQGMGLTVAPGENEFLGWDLGTVDLSFECPGMDWVEQKMELIDRYFHKECIIVESGFDENSEVNFLLADARESTLGGGRFNVNGQPGEAFPELS